MLWGADRTAITGVEFNGLGLHMLAPDKALGDAIGGNLDLRWTATQRKDCIIKSDIPAFCARYVEGLRLRDIQVDWAIAVPDNFSDGMRVEDFSDVTIDGFSRHQAQAASGSAIALRHGTGVAVANSRAMAGTQTFQVWIR